MNRSATPLSSTSFASLLALATPFVLAAGLSGQGFTKAPLKTGLLAPNGIAVSPTGEIYFTELPEPGKFGGKNTVSRLDASGNQVVLVKGEPGPTNLAFDPKGNFYWTCSTAGVLMIGSGSSHRSIANGLKNPNGIAVDSMGNVFFTQIPDPGQANKGNNVAQLVGGKAVVLKQGEPEPFDLVVADDGTLYWTCRSAGVILKRDPKGAVSKILTGLEKPSGLAMDAKGRLYFSEVPTPGTFGNKGGRNKVWQYDPATQNFALISFGEPYPVDVAVTKDGSKVYWTCRSVGVIFRADRATSPVASITTTSTGKLGTTATLDLVAPMSARKPYRVASALGLGPIGFDQRFVGLAPDAIFFASFFDQLNVVFMNYGGMLDAGGKASAKLVIPNDANLRGLIVQTAFFTFDRNAMSGVAEASTSLRTVFQ